jgi:hypothetical protein
MFEGIVPSGNAEGRVVVYDTYARDGELHFDVFLRDEEGAKESDMNRRALAVAKAFLEAIAQDTRWAKLSGCTRCHLEELRDYAPRALWHVPSHDAWIKPLAGCPRPAERGPQR